MKRLSIFVTLSYLAVFALVSCSKQEGEYFFGALGLDQPRVILSSSVAGNHVVSMYDSEGNFLKRFFDYTAIGGTPRGLAPYGNLGFIVAVDGLDQFDFIGLDGAKTVWGKNAQVPGAYYDITKDSDDNYYVIDANTIEKFDSLGNRIPITAVTPYIATTVGGCTLSTPTSLTINANGQLVVANNVTSTISIYNLTTPPTCATQVAFGNNPRALLSHSNGSLYVITQNNAQETLWRADANAGSAVSLFANTTSVLQDGFALAELPNGNILASSTGTDAVIEFDEDGNLIRTFAKDANTNDVFSILVIGGDGQ